MRKTGQDSFAILRTGVDIFIILAISGMISFTGSSRLSVGLTHNNQDPAIPPSPPSVTLAPDNLDFGDQVVRRTSAAKRITLKNTGGQPLHIDSVDLGGDNPNSFVLLKDTCTGATVEPERACILDVTFTPSRTGGRNARLKLNDNALDSPQRLKLKGNGINASAVPPF
jgi:Abnormal spindle-like microcephaly-assoc'd, ASPM-SPD-2-Hydin